MIGIGAVNAIEYNSTDDVISFDQSVEIAVSDNSSNLLNIEDNDEVLSVENASNEILSQSDDEEILSLSDNPSSYAQVNSTVVEPSTSQPDEKTYPFYADDGSIVGYYHVGDVVTHYDGLYQLKSNGEWVYIGEAEGASQEAYNQGYSDAIDDTYDDYSYYEDDPYYDYYSDYGDYDAGYY